MRPIRTVLIGPQTDMLTEILNIVLSAKLPLAIVGRGTGTEAAAALSGDHRPDLVLVCKDAPLSEGVFDRLCAAVAPAQLVVVAAGGSSVGTVLTAPGLGAVVNLIAIGCADRSGAGTKDLPHG